MNADHDDASDEDDPLEREALDRDFPLGDGTAATSATVVCPHCAQEVEIALDPGGGPYQEYVEDCEVCCNPWQLVVTWNQDGSADIVAEPLDA